MLDKNKLCGAIASAGMTHYELAGQLGMSKNTFSSKINGKGYFDTKQIDRMCLILKIDDLKERASIFLAS